MTPRTTKALELVGNALLAFAWLAGVCVFAYFAFTSLNPQERSAGMLGLIVMVLVGGLWVWKGDE